MVVQFYFLGLFDLRCDQQALLKPPTQKSQSLLAYLVLNRQHPHLRDHLVNLFWGERPQKKARRSLTTALWHLRTCLPQGEFILSDHSCVQFNPNKRVWVDVDEFYKLIHTDAVEKLAAGLNLYRGSLLAGFYDDWVMNERYRLDINYTEALAKLMGLQQKVGDYQESLRTAQRLIKNDPSYEDAYRVSMRAYYQMGQKQAALKQYQRLCQVLEDELRIEPEPDTQELFQAIYEGDVAIETQVPILSHERIKLSSERGGRHPLETMGENKLVGREKELESLEECWQAIPTGNKRFILVQGEAGVGKTRLVEEFVNQKRWRGVRVLYGRCYEFERMLPYQPVVDSMRPILLNLTTSERQNLPDWVIAELAYLVPELSELISEGDHQSQTKQPQERQQLFDAILTFIANLTSQGKILLVIEDLHWASEATLQLIHYLVRNLADTDCFVLATSRVNSGNKWQSGLELSHQLEQDGLAKTIRLPCLTAAEVEKLVINMSGAGAQVLPLAQWLYQETDGNPFFLMESVKALFEGGKIELKDDVWQGALHDVTAWQLKVPVSISQLIQSRLRRLDQSALDTLRLASVIGREFDFDLLSTIQGQGEEGTLTAIDHLLRSRLIEEGQTPVESDYVFSHHLVHEVVYQSIPARHKSRKHVLVAQALEQQHLEHPSRSSAELAYHYLRAGTINRHYVEKSIAYSIKAGDQARMLYAHKEAIDHYQRAVSLLDQERDYERAARTLMKIASTYHNAFDFKGVQKALEDSFEMWRRVSKKQSRLNTSSVNKTLSLPWQDPLSLDPTKAFNTYAWGIAKQLFSRLIEFGPDGEIIPDIAKTWEVTQDGKKYVFHLRDDVHWSDGTPLTAGDFEFGWKRLLDPATGWIHASLMYDIKGGRTFHQGEINDPDFVGVYAQDAITLVVELEKPTGYFLYLLGYVCPVPRHIFKKFGESWAEAEHIVTNGAFQVKDCCWKKIITLTRNPNYYGKYVGNVKDVILSLLPLQEWHTMLELYQAGKLDTLDLTTFPPQEIEVIRSRFASEYLSGADLLTYSLGFNTSVPPFNDRNVRLAFAHAIERELMVENLYHNAAMVANGGFIPPGMPGHSPDIGLAYNPDRARDLLAAAGYPGGLGFPKVHALYLDTPYRNPVFKYLQHQWSNILGIENSWEGVDWEEYVNRIENSPPHISAMRWLGQYYPDPDDFMKVGMSHARIFTKWENQDYDALVEQARPLTDQSKRIKLYTQADRILIDEVGLYPLFYGQIQLLVKPSLKGFIVNHLNSWSFKDIIVGHSQI